MDLETLQSYELGFDLSEGIAEKKLEVQEEQSQVYDVNLDMEMD